jgi:hypothetical protein
MDVACGKSYSTDGSGIPGVTKRRHKGSGVDNSDWQSTYHARTPVQQMEAADRIETGCSKIMCSGSSAGAAVFGKLMRLMRVTWTHGSPTAMDTVFGRVPKGRTDGITHSTSVTTHLDQCSLNNLLQRFWALEEVPTQKLLTSEEKDWKEIFEATHYRDESGRHVVQLPFKEATPRLGALEESSPAFEVDGN